MSNRRERFERASIAPSVQIQYIDPKVARELPLIFGFKNMDLDKKPFDCSEGDGKGMLYILKTLTHFSNTSRSIIDINFKNCHPVPEEDIRKHNLTNFVKLSSSGKLHQLGRKQTPQRIVGYYEDFPKINQFQICLLDLQHKLSGD